MFQALPASWCGRADDSDCFLIQHVPVYCKQLVCDVQAAAKTVTNLPLFKEIDYLVNNAGIANAEQTRAE